MLEVAGVSVWRSGGRVSSVVVGVVIEVICERGEVVQGAETPCEQGVAGKEGATPAVHDRKSDTLTIPLGGHALPMASVMGGCPSPRFDT